MNVYLNNGENMLKGLVRKMKNEWNWMIEEKLVKSIGKSFPPQEVITHLKLKGEEE